MKREDPSQRRGDRRELGEGKGPGLVADNESFVAMIAYARQDEQVETRLLEILRLDTAGRCRKIDGAKFKLRLLGVEARFIEALDLLKDDQVAKKALQALDS